MSEMVEAVAKAIEEAMFAPHELPLSERVHAQFLVVAAAAIAPARERLRKMLIMKYEDYAADLIDEALR